jgi:hypothetical protein
MELLERWAWVFALKHWADGASQDVLEHLGSLNQSQLLSNGQLSSVALDVCAEDERNGLVPRALQHVVYQLIDSAHKRFVSQATLSVVGQHKKKVTKK